MGADANIKTIRMIYEAFGRGDVEAIRAGVTEDVDWAAEASEGGAPWYGPHRGPAGVADFFTAFGTAMEIEEFTPLAFGGSDTEVFTVVHCRARSRATGRGIDHDLHHYFRFSNGKIAYYRGTEDTAQTVAALAP
jgi:hypothetical protein